MSNTIGTMPEMQSASVTQYPPHGLIIKRYGSGFYIHTNGREATTDIASVSYDVFVQTTLSSFQILNSKPKYQRWDCDCYPAQSGDICDLVWTGDIVSFKVDEPPVLEDCSGANP